MSGLDVAAALRRRSKSTPLLVALSGWGRDEDRRRSLAAGFDMHLTKPVGLEEIEDAIRAVRAPAITEAPRPTPAPAPHFLGA